MTEVQFLKPKTVDEAIDFYKESGGKAKILAGGTDLLVQIRSGISSPDKIIDVKSISDLQQITDNGEGSFVIGAAVSGAVLEEHKSFGVSYTRSSSLVEHSPFTYFLTIDKTSSTSIISKYLSFSMMM